MSPRSRELGLPGHPCPSAVHVRLSSSNRNSPRAAPDVLGSRWFVDGSGCRMATTWLQSAAEAADRKRCRLWGVASLGVVVGLATWIVLHQRIVGRDGEWVSLSERFQL